MHPQCIPLPPDNRITRTQKVDPELQQVVTSGIEDLESRVIYPSRKWAFVYIAVRSRLGRTEWKIGVSSRPWKRMVEVGAEDVVFSRLVYRPYNLEKVLHRAFQRFLIGHEWFALEEWALADAKKMIELWQLLANSTDDIDGYAGAKIEGQVLTDFPSLHPTFWARGNV